MTPSLISGALHPMNIFILKRCAASFFRERVIKEKRQEHLRKCVLVGSEKLEVFEETIACGRKRQTGDPLAVASKDFGRLME